MQIKQKAKQLEKRGLEPRLGWPSVFWGQKNPQIFKIVELMGGNCPPTLIVAVRIRLGSGCGK
jgi:hypothetical protein